PRGCLGADGAGLRRAAPRSRVPLRGRRAPGVLDLRLQARNVLALRPGRRARTRQLARAGAQGEAGKGAPDRTGSDVLAGVVRRPDLTSGERRPPGKTILLPGGDDELRALVAAEAPIPVEVVTNPSAPLGPSDLAVLVVDQIGPAVRAAVTRVVTEEVPYVVL